MIGREKKEYNDLFAVWLNILVEKLKTTGMSS